MLDDLRKLVTEQRALIDGQAERIGALERALATLKQPQAATPLPADVPLNGQLVSTSAAPTGDAEGGRVGGRRPGIDTDSRH